MAKFRVILEGDFEVADDDLERIYGTTDPEECARIESINDYAALAELLWDCQQSSKRVVVVN